MTAFYDGDLSELYYIVKKRDPMGEVGVGERVAMGFAITMGSAHSLPFFLLFSLLFFF